MGGARSLGDVRRWTYERSASGRSQGIDAADDIAAAPLSRNNCETLSRSMKAPSFSETESASSMYSTSSARIAADADDTILIG
jgi:hypothetical protein